MSMCWCKDCFQYDKGVDYCLNPKSNNYMEKVGQYNSCEHSEKRGINVKVNRIGGIDIEFDNGYRLTSDPLCYQLETIRTIEDRKSSKYGEKAYSLVGYFATIEGVFESMFENEVKLCGSENIEDFIKEVRSIKQELKQIAKNNLNITVIEKGREDE